MLRGPLEASVTLLEATTPVKLPAKRCPCIRMLGARRTEGGISRSAPGGPGSPARSLPPILRTVRPTPALSCSEGSRGLFVPLRVGHTKLSGSGLEPYFETLTVSEEVGVKKPNPEIFFYALRKAQATADRWECS